jgi:hypothetical protein
VGGSNRDKRGTLIPGGANHQDQKLELFFSRLSIYLSLSRRGHIFPLFLALPYPLPSQSFSLFFHARTGARRRTRRVGTRRRGPTASRAARLGGGSSPWRRLGSRRVVARACDERRSVATAGPWRRWRGQAPACGCAA